MVDEVLTKIQLYVFDFLDGLEHSLISFVEGSARDVTCDAITAVLPTTNDRNDASQFSNRGVISGQYLQPTTKSKNGEDVLGCGMKSNKSKNQSEEYIRFVESNFEFSNSTDLLLRPLIEFANRLRRLHTSLTLLDIPSHLDSFDSSGGGNKSFMRAEEYVIELIFVYISLLDLTL